MWKKLLLTLVVLGFGTLVALFCYFNYYVPVYEWKDTAERVVIDGTAYAKSQLIYEGKVYEEDYFVDPSKLDYGWKIGRTADGMRIYAIEGHPDKVALTGFMFPHIIFTRIK